MFENQPEGDENHKEEEEEERLVYDERFVWNNYLIEPLLHFRSRLSSVERRRLDDSSMIVSESSLFVIGLLFSIFELQYSTPLLPTLLIFSHSFY